MQNKPRIIDARKKTPEMSQSIETIKMMHDLHITPTPEHYAVWYNHLGGKNKNLSKDIANVRKQGLRFTDGVNKRLYEEYIQPPSAGVSPEKLNAVMKKLMALISRYSNQATAYNDELGKTTDTLSDRIEGDEKMEGLLGDVVAQLREIQYSNTKFTTQMKSSQQEITQLRENLEIATTEARIDGLTKIYNRRAFDELIEELTSQSKQNHENLCLLMLDIDHFKEFNDRWGHQIGDEVLKVVAGALRRTVRGNDIIARYGGEEFAILLPDTPIKGAEVVAENIRNLIARNRIKRKDSTNDMGQITVSVGVTQFKSEDPKETIESFIRRADDALYSAKEGGRNKVASEV